VQELIFSPAGDHHFQCIIVASAKLLQPDCKTRRLMQLATGLCRCAELAAGAVQ
jgi:hypothetical protein